MRDAGNFWLRKLASPGGKPLTEAAFLYELSCITPSIVVQGEVPRAGVKLPLIFQISEN